MTKEIQILIGKMQVLKFHNPVCENISNIGLGSWEYDVLSVSKSGMMYEFEVKISRGDFKADLKKRKHEFYKSKIERLIPNYTSYACPKDLISLFEIPEYTGLYYIDNGNVLEIRKPKRLHDFVHDKNKILEKICRVNAERTFLGSCRLTYENNQRKEKFIPELLTQNK